MPNYNPKSRVPYGIIACNSLDSELVQELWYTHGEDISYKNALEELRESVSAQMIDEEENGECPIRSVDDFNDELDEIVERRAEHIQIDEPTIEGEYEGVKYQISWLGGAPLLWVFWSPFVNPHAQCSPCCPGAGDLDSEGDVLCYDVPDSWRRSDESTT